MEAHHSSPSQTESRSENHQRSGSDEIRERNADGRVDEDAYWKAVDRAVDDWKYEQFLEAE